MTAEAVDLVAAANVILTPPVLLATDLERASAHAAERALDLAERLRSPLLIVSVIDPTGLRLPGGGYTRRIDQVRAARESSAQQLVDDGRRRGVPVRFLVWHGDPGESIIAAADAEGAEMIVVGSHGRAGVNRLLMGSVSEYVVRHAACPVLVVRPPQRTLPMRDGSAA
jgi:nucleotide-binding universal stress UspA family protein